MTERTKRSVLARYWPVVVVVGAVAAVLAITSSGDDQGGETAPPTSATPTVTGPPALLSFKGEDPLGAPDCDRSTGRLEIPMVYSPNCVPLWEKGRDNGGATYPGVTATEVKVAIYLAQSDAEVTAAVEEATGLKTPTASVTEQNRTQVFNVLNSLWETYGRKVTYTLLKASGGPSDDAAAKADAIKAAKEIGAFVVLGGPTGTKAFAEELAARHVVCICAEGYPNERYDEWAPYVYGSGISSTFRNSFELDLVTSLAHGNAEYAGDELKSTPRKFALVHYETVDEVFKVAAEQLVSDLEKRDIPLLRLPYTLDLATAQENARTMVARMKSDGITSVLLSGDPFMPYFLAAEASSQKWYPEWILTGAGLVDTAVAGRSYDQTQWKHAFGLSTLLARIDPKAVDPNANFVSWALGKELSSYPSIFDAPTVFTGIQLAGPHLTPETFRAGLFSFKRTSGFITNWGVSWGSDTWGVPDYTAADDVTLVWWDGDAVGPSETQTDGAAGKGMWRYVDGGKRYAKGELAGVRPVFFDPASSILLLPDRPSSDASPDYPRRTSRSG